MGWGTPGDTAAVEIIGRSQDLVACEVRLAAATAPMGDAGGEEDETGPIQTDDGSGSEYGSGQGGEPATVTDDVDVYDVPGGDGHVVGLLDAGTAVRSSGCTEDNWCEVVGHGWVWGDFLRSGGGEDQAGPVQTDESAGNGDASEYGSGPGGAESGLEATVTSDVDVYDSPGGEGDAESGLEATVTSDVDVYDSPGGEGDVVGMLHEGDTVQASGCDQDNWCEVPGSGWVWRDFLRF